MDRKKLLFATVLAVLGFVVTNRNNCAAPENWTNWLRRIVYGEPGEPGEPYNITLTTPHGLLTYELSVRDTDTIYDIKQKMEDKYSIIPCRFHASARRTPQADHVPVFLNGITAGSKW